MQFTSFKFCLECDTYTHEQILLCNFRKKEYLSLIFTLTFRDLIYAWKIRIIDNVYKPKQGINTVIIFHTYDFLYNTSKINS